jgi:molybdopterin molybdotransferase
MRAPSKPASCADDFDPSALTCEQALAHMRATLRPLNAYEKLNLRAGLWRVLFSDIEAAGPVPPHDCSAMDGYAVRGAELTDDGSGKFELIGTALAGKPYLAPVGPGQCVRAMTGGVMPTGTDTVVMQEDTEIDGDTVHVLPGQQAGQNVHRAGEDIAPGQSILRAGRRLTPADLGLLASLGVPEVPVVRRLRVAFFSTGDELRSLGQPLGEGMIYDSNRYTLYAMLTRLGAEVLDLGVVPDEREALSEALRMAANSADVVITSGGVSVGEADFVKECLEEVGQIAFWKIAMKPGRPLAFGRIGQAWFFGLPGNPVSVMATFYQFVQPALRRLMGETETPPLQLTARCLSKLRKKPGRVEFQRGILENTADGELVVRKTGEQGSGILRSMSEANCFIILPMDSGRVEPGTQVTVQPFAGLI